MWRSDDCQIRRRIPIRKEPFRRTTRSWRVRIFQWKNPEWERTVDLIASYSDDISTIDMVVYPTYRYFGGE
jgi:hypothetical protein